MKDERIVIVLELVLGLPNDALAKLGPRSLIDRRNRARLQPFAEAPKRSLET